MRIAFVILHYLAGDDTIECIKSIMQNISYENKILIVVDNASTNDSFKQITELYQDNRNIILMSNKNNLGFARGNNIGYRYAKEIYKAEFIVLLNNDTLINQQDFCKIIIEKWEEKNFFVLGPDIVNRDGYHQNPMKYRDWNERKLILFKLKAQIRLLDLKLFCLGPLLLKKKNKITGVKCALEGDFTNIRLHGACLIFSPEYIKRFDGLDDGTFLYMEEDLLQMQMGHYDFPMWYTSSLKIYHKDDASTNMASKNAKERDIHFLKNLIDSIDVCINRIQNMKKEET